MSAELRRLRSIVIDCRRPSALAAFWAEVLGYTVRPYGEEDIAELKASGIYSVEDDPSVVIDPPSPELPDVWFNEVPEPKTLKNRVHIDVNLRSLDEADRIVALGARVVRRLDEVPEDRWLIMADPEGNEFCAFPPES